MSLAAPAGDHWLAGLVATSAVWKRGNTVPSVCTLAGAVTRRPGCGPRALPGRSGGDGGGIARIAGVSLRDRAAIGGDLAGARDGCVARRRRPSRGGSARARRIVADRNRARSASGLVTSGVYRFCRNPIFFAILSVLTGYTLLLPTRLSLVLLVSAFVGMRLQVLAEEAYLSKTYGATYREYARGVGRFLPGIGRLR